MAIRNKLIHRLEQWAHFYSKATEFVMTNSGFLTMIIGTLEMNLMKISLAITIIWQRRTNKQPIWVRMKNISFAIQSFLYQILNRLKLLPNKIIYLRLEPRIPKDKISKPLLISPEQSSVLQVVKLSVCIFNRRKSNQYHHWVKNILSNLCSVGNLWKWHRRWKTHESD